MRYWVSAAALAVGLSTAVPAWAGEKQDFEACDGRVHPARQDDGMRGEPNKPSYLRSTFSTPATTIAACNRALASSRLLPTQTVRRAHLLRARAAAHLQTGDTAKALADLAQAQAAAPDRANDRFYRRSMGVSLDLLGAIAHAKAGDSGRARALVQAAMAQRPYSSQVQQLGAQIVQAVADGTTNARSDWAMAMRLDPRAATSVLLREAEVGNFAAVLALRPGITLNWPEKAPPSLALLGGDSGGGVDLMSALLVSLHTAYAYAATGAPDKAKAELAGIRSRMQALKAPPAEKDKTKAALPNLAALLESAVEVKVKQVEARIAVAERRNSEAIAAMVGASLPKDAATTDLIKSLKAAASPTEAALVPDAAAFTFDATKKQRDNLSRLASQALIAPETPRAVVDYEKSRPNILGALVGGALSMGTSLLGGIDRLDGFRSKANADGTTKVEFVGNTPSALLVQEMTLLRAAEVTRAAGKPAFVIVERKDYSRVMRTMQYGVEISSTPTGFKTEMDIRFLDSADQSPRALDALAVIDALGPLYYEEKRTRA
jgi:hypothetical protein